MIGAGMILAWIHTIFMWINVLFFIYISWLSILINILFNCGLLTVAAVIWSLHKRTLPMVIAYAGIYFMLNTVMFIVVMKVELMPLFIADAFIIFLIAATDIMCAFLTDH